MARPRPREGPDPLQMPQGRRIPRSPQPRPAMPDAAGADPPLDLGRALEKAGGELVALASRIRGCRACGRASDRRAFGSGYPRAPILLVKEHPSDEDLRTQTAFASEADALGRAFERLGIPLGWVYASTAVRCASGRAAADEVKACAVHLLEEIEAVGPSVVVAFGERALDAVRALDGRCGIRVPEDVGRGEAVEIRRGTRLMWTEPLPEGVTEAEAKRRLWADLQRLQGLLGG